MYNKVGRRKYMKAENLKKKYTITFALNENEYKKLMTFKEKNCSSISALARYAIFKIIEEIEK